MTPTVRRIVYVTIYELVALVVVTTALSLVAGKPAMDTGVVAVASSVIAVSWAYVFNLMFERWEASRRVRGRSTRRRIVHAVLYEAGLVLMLVPLIAWQLDATLLEAFLYDLGLILFFTAYTFGFTWVFDRVFGLPASAA
ncbi:PACE efflux transporter [Rhodoplanes sp. TEM]|uniref:PACE efflux transporter n=1 Tax=Rhodoplanes tepidamans TaxID=200616 RepID=A0ABT5J4L4_RHOTP|nr:MULTISPECIES: PACE efflux transporter [Rhodoplanes]MDC7784572.1 PACE efflux transporter [Rhodoplanes tepidamans]MDC7984479.1 PACE efflux transporter [Rhodoplanes sp. TEM]MDQ0355800.1 putative membrane protein [Rhodoplanes tepidamans]